MDAKRRPPPIPEKTVAGMPPAKPPVPGPLPTPPTQLESQVGRLEVEGETTNQVPSNADGGEHQGDGGANERFDPPVGGQFTSPAVAIMDPMKKQARRKTNLPPGYSNQQQNALPPGASPSQLPALSSGYVGKGASAASPNGVQAGSDTIQQVQPTASQQQPQKHLRSPSVKRAPGSTVTMQGWLHKQGSDGLMRWKRRWFVLSEFCLFYYKGPEEEKVLGSILLPSYVISPCSSEEPKRGGHRKHSFKAEHHNMRTYYFAADSSEAMERWMYNMNLASLLQRNFTTGAISEGASWDERQSGRPSVSSFSSLLNQSADDSDSGFHGGRSPKHATIAVGSSNPGQSATVPAWAAKGKKLEEETISEVSREREAATTYRKGIETTPEVPSLPAEFQPLYANAPPKPRRLNSGGRDYSTSPERSPERKGEDESVVLRSKGPINEPQQNGMYVDRSQRISRPMVSYASIRHERNSSYQQQNMQAQHPVGIQPPNQMVFPVMDRRTPDTYGRSNTGDNSTAGIPKMVQNRVDYEDVYSVNHSSDPMVGRMNRWSSGPYDTQHLYPKEVHLNTVQQQPPHVHLCPPSGHSPQQGLQQHTHGAQLGVVQRMPIAHPYTVSPTTAQHQHPPLAQQHLNQQLLPPQPQPQVFHRRTPPLPRPHSADFLGHYDHNQMSYVMPLPANIGGGTSSIEQPSPKMPSGAVEDAQKQYPNTQTIDAREQNPMDVISAQQVQRPKSSMDIRPVSQTLSFDPTDYWSEESYARMMRQSLYMHAHHVHPSSSSSHKGSETSSGMGHQQLQNWSAYGQETTPAVGHQSSSRVPQATQKQQPIEPVELRSKGPEDATTPVPQRQSTPSGKRDMNQGGHFLRSASARMPRSRYHSGENHREQSTALSTVPGDEARNGERKMQQREESMRRLLEWKQRMLQSPLTRKSSSSSTPRKATQDSTPHNSSQMSSSHYKQMVLKQLANQEAAASTNNWEHTSRRGGSRRGPDDVRSARSRSHDGRRTSASLSRYNSYSSDDEEALGESRKRVRRGPQAGRGRRGTGGGEEPPTPPQNPSSAPPLIPPPKPPQSHHHQHPHHHHHHKPPPQIGGGGKIEHQASHAVADPPRHTNHRDRGNYEGSKSPSSPEPTCLTADGGGIPPDASYADVESSGQCVDWHPARWEANRSAVSSSRPLSPPEKRLHFEDEICKRGREIRASSRLGNEKRHAVDSHETSRHAHEKPPNKLSVSFGISRSEKPGQAEGREDGSDFKRSPEGDQAEAQGLATDTHINEEGNVSKLKSRKTLHDLRSKRENPPKNIVQNRIKEFEPKDGEGWKNPVATTPPEMKEPLNPSPSFYRSNEAHIYPLRNKDGKRRDADSSERERDVHMAFDSDRRGAGGGGTAADIESSDEGTSSPPPPLPASSPPTLPVQTACPPGTLESLPYKATTTTRSVRELLADFERKSEQKKRMEEEEESAWDSAVQGMSNGRGKGGREQDRFSPGRRYVFSDTETLLYDTGSDLDEDSEISRQWKARREDLAGGAVPRDIREREEGDRREKVDKILSQPEEGIEEGDSEVESALGRRNRFGVARDLHSLSGGADQGKNGSGPGDRKTVVESSEAMEVITTPGYLRLSLAESLVTHEDLVSPFDSSADATPPLPSAKNPAEEEEHYMPMTPSRKSILASPSSLQNTGPSPTSASHSVIMESVFGSNGTFWAQVDAEEESSYVEMTEEGLVKSLLVSETLSPSLAPLSIFAPPMGRGSLELCRKNSGESTATYAVPESPSYSEIPGGGIFDSALGRNPSSHYELLSRASTQYEPVYMEVRSVKEGTNPAGDEASRLCIKGGKAISDTDRTVAGSDEERCLRKDKRKKSKVSPSDDACVSTKGGEFADRKSTYPSDTCRAGMGGMLPDILSGSSTANQRRSLEEEIGTESSDVGDEDEEDADDEASKDLDSLDAPRHPRFSLSDTFRPASYYLGASDRTFAVGGAGKGGLGGGDSGSGLMNMVGGGVDGSANELQGDSSDSDLVSPPPIPTSPPPPLDDDDVLGESIEDSDEKKSSAKTQSGPHPQAAGACKNSPSVQRTVISPTVQQPDGSSLSDISDTASTVCSLRRRPVTGNILDSLINSAPNKSDIPSELYMRRNEILNEYGDYKRRVDFDSSLSPSLPPELWPRPEDGLPSALPEALHRRIASADDAAVLYENVHTIMKPRMKADVIRPPLPPHRSSSPFVKVSESPNPHIAAGRLKSPETVKVPTHIRGSSQDGETSGAPYYYSDLLRSEFEDPDFARTASERGAVRNAMHPSPSSWRPSRIPLNNQRDDVLEISAKRNDVGRKVNRIQPPMEALHAAAFRRTDQPQRAEFSPDYPRDNCEGVDKLMAADLLLIGADKRVDFDERNIYETDTLKKVSRRRRAKDQQWENQISSQPQQMDPPMHRRCYTPDSLPDSRVTRNIYPYGLMDKSNDGDFSGSLHETQFSQQNGFQERANRWRRRSRSLEGLLDEENESLFVSNPIGPTAGRQSHLTSPPFSNVQVNTWDKSPAATGMNLTASPPSVNHDAQVMLATGDFNGADPWNEDNLWRESLRRVSLRHTRSLDHLDDCSGPGPNPTSPSGRRSVDLLAANGADGSRKSRVSRGVTYVNDRVAVTTERRNRIRPVNKPPPATGTMEDGGRTDRRVDAAFEGVQEVREGYERYPGRTSTGKERAGRDHHSYPKGSYECDESKVLRRRAADSQTPISEHFLGEDAPPSPPQSPPPGEDPGPGFEIDREKLRQWDLMSSAPLPGMAAGSAAAGKVIVAGGRRGAGAVEAGGGEGKGLPRADETVARGEGEAGRVRDESESSGGQTQKQQESRTPAPVTAASGSGSIREPAPVRHSKNDPSSTMLVISQPTSIPIQSPTYVQPPNARLGVPQLKHHAVQPHGAEGEGEVEGKGRQWRGNEGMVNQAVPMLRWERDGIQPMRKPEDSATPERDFHSMQRNTTSQKHDVSNGGGGRGRKGRESGEADKAGERRRGDGGRGEVSVSAGDLLGRTHEELVLLLIQLRRQSAAVSNAIDLCQADLSAQARLAELEMHRRVEHLKKLEELKKHLLELEKQYEKGKPLINLVDNMVKLGSLYRGNTDAQGRIRGWRGTGGEASTGPSPAKDRLQFNQRVQEQRLLAEERRDWSRLSPDHGELQAKVQQLYRLDRLLQEESVTIQSLQQDKELLEKALGGLRHKLQGSGVPSIGNMSGSTSRDLSSTKGGAGNASVVDPAEAERYRKQQRMLERELSRVRQLLAQNSKKLEETVAENARLEQELVVLRQKLQLSRRTLDSHPTSQSPGSASNNPASPGGATASLEAELRRVQSAVGDLQRQRHELSVQVRQLTEKSHSLVEQIRPGPTGVAGAGPIPAKKRHHSTWMETDLDSMESMDCGIESPGPGPSPSRGAPMLQPMVHSPPESTPLYVNTTLGQHVEREDVGRRPTMEEQQSMANGYELAEGEAGEEAQGYQAMDINEADDRMKRFYGIIPREKPEIKTVRIVKRESERRHRDRSSKRVVLVDDPCENPCASSSSSLNRVLEEEVVEGEEEEEAMAYHAHQHQSPHNMSSSVPFSPGFLGPPEDDPILSQFFQRSLSLPRVLGKQRGQPPPVPPLRVASPRGSSAAVRRQQLRLRSEVNERPRSAHEQLFGTSQEEPPCLQQPSLSYSVLPSYSSSPSSHSASPTLFSPSDRAYPSVPPTPDSPPPIAYKSEAAREIALEMAALHSGEDWADGSRGSVKKRATPKEKRRHYTVSCSRPLELESIVLPKMGSARSRDDLDMEQVLRPRLNAPDVVRSTMSHRDFKYNEHTIDSVLGTPNKILIPERYIPEQAPELSEEEQMHRLKKAEAIRKMLSETTPITAPEVEENQQKKTSIIKKKVAEEKRQRDHILQLNQILAKQVMEKSKMVAVRALATLPLHENSTDDDELSSPVQPLPLTQQRHNFFS